MRMKTPRSSERAGPTLLPLVLAFDCPFNHPGTVTLPGSPPKADTLRRTRTIAARWSLGPNAAGPGRPKKPNTPSR
ncbi:hypothetical protein GCM10022222_05690 [Amycolatopsis ultiminotia]|uniref:Uncharacterized protein n=1 Tax=Amycolatopsis ultiminotia TaxID=543629 RepID=A0ABP6UZ12_9PSEU